MIKIGYCATWANGVCKDGSQSALFEDSAKESLRRLLRRVDSVVLGYNAYRLLLEKKFNFSNTKLVVISKENVANLNDGVTAAQNPKQALDHFATLSSPSVLVAGGLQTLNSFMNQGFIDELIVDIEPALMPGAQTLFSDLSRRINLEQIGMRKIGAATIQMHYRILNY